MIPFIFLLLHKPDSTCHVVVEVAPHMLVNLLIQFQRQWYMLQTLQLLTGIIKKKQGVWEECSRFDLCLMWAHISPHTTAAERSEVRFPDWIPLSRINWYNQEWPVTAEGSGELSPRYSYKVKVIIHALIMSTPCDTNDSCFCFHTICFVTFLPSDLVSLLSLKQYRRHKK